MQETWVRSLGREDPSKEGRSLEKEMAVHSSTIAWKIPRTEEPGRLQSMGLQRVGHDWATSFNNFLQPPDILWIHWRVYNSIANTRKGVFFLPAIDIYVRSFLYLLYTSIKLYYTKALSNQASSLALNWILLLRRPRIPVSLRGSTTTFQGEEMWNDRQIENGKHLEEHLWQMRRELDQRQVKNHLVTQRSWLQPK